MEFRNLAFLELKVFGNQANRSFGKSCHFARLATSPHNNMLPRYVPLITSSHFETIHHRVPREYIKIRLGIWLTGFVLYYEVSAKVLEYFSIIRSFI